MPEKIVIMHDTNVYKDIRKLKSVNKRLRIGVTAAIAVAMITWYKLCEVYKICGTENNNTDGGK